MDCGQRDPEPLSVPQAAADELPPPVPRRQLPFMRPGLQWLVAIAVLLLPAIALVVAVGSVSPQAAVLLFFLGASLLPAWGFVEVFDPGALPSPSRPCFWGGVVLKVLAVLHALAALAATAALIDAVCYRGFASRNVGIGPGGAVVLAAWLWVVAVLAYLCGDAHMQAVRRARQH